MVGDGLDLRQIEGGQSDSGGDQDALGGLARRQLEYLVLPDSHTVRLFPFHSLEQEIQGGDILLVLLLDLGVFQHPHDHGEVLLILRSLLPQHEDDGLEQRRLRLGPKRVRFMAALGGGGLDEIVHQFEGVLFIPDIAEGVVTVTLCQVDQIQHPDVIALAFEIPTSGQQHLRFGVGDDIVGVGLQDVWLHIAAGLGGAAAADDQHVEGTAVLVGVQPQADVSGQQLVLLLAELGVDLLGCGPGRRAVFRAVPPAALLRAVQGQGHDIGAGADQDGQQALVCPAHHPGISKGIGQLGDDFRQPPSQGLSQKQRAPDHGDIQEQADQQAA